ncbi:MAG: 4-hydroxy-3-methylbut-2-enyl diphosphate reductase [Clostridiales bacterium]|nr:4-hydroxy-3-methylbut-2-enyl diphosphate reductase [Clostridiales bacterium]
MIDVKIADVCGLCAGCKNAIATTEKELASGSRVTIFKEIVHNKNVNNYLHSIGAGCVDNITDLSSDNVIIIRAHGEPPATYEYLESNGIEYRDCTCPNVSKIHSLVNKYSEQGYRVIILGKYKNTLHPEVFGTMGWAGVDPVLIETADDVSKLKEFRDEKFYLVCQTTFNIQKAESLIEEVKRVLYDNMCELIVNKSLCIAQKTINESSVQLAKECDIMIVVGGANSSNSIELYNNVNSICPSVFIEDIAKYRDAIAEKGLVITANTRVGITAGASTRKEELLELKALIEKDFG